MKALRVDPNDTVAVVIQPTPKDAAINAGDVTVVAAEDIETGYKIALLDIPRGASVYKYGVVIGRAARDIAAGSHVHDHNLLDITGELCRLREERQDGGES